jgi:TatA/E family protein of Tat protein translocase
MFGLGHWEILGLVFIALLLFGSTKLPALARSMGTAINEFKEGLKHPEEEEKEKPGEENTGKDSNHA